MSREVRRVPADWEHPKNTDGQYKPLHPGARYMRQANDFMEHLRSMGLQRTIEWRGMPPDMRDFMPDWPEDKATHFMMYENTTEGTPISPAFTTPEKLANWLVATGAIGFTGQTAPYESWLRVARGGYAPSFLIVPGLGLVDGVNSLHIGKDKKS